jgi:hypothetical protein
VTERREAEGGEEGRRKDKSMESSRRTEQKAQLKREKGEAIEEQVTKQPGS